MARSTDPRAGDRLARIAARTVAATIAWDDAFAELVPIMELASVQVASAGESRSRSHVSPRGFPTRTVGVVATEIWDSSGPRSSSKPRTARVSWDRRAPGPMAISPIRVFPAISA